MVQITIRFGVGILGMEWDIITPLITVIGVGVPLFIILGITMVGIIHIIIIVMAVTNLIIHTILRMEVIPIQIGRMKRIVANTIVKVVIQTTALQLAQHVE